MKGATATVTSTSRTRRHLRVVRPSDRPERCPACRSVLDAWACEMARAERRPLGCAACGALLV